MANVGRPIGRRHQEDVRAKIQASQLINVLQNHALDANSGELSASRLKAIEILLKKSVPDLSSVEITGEDGGPIQHEHTVGFDTAAADLLAKIRAAK